MLLPNDQKKIDRCTAENNGICLYKPRVCDGLCNNCPLDIAPGEKIETGLTYQPRLVLSYDELNALENRCLPSGGEYE